MKRKQHWKTKSFSGYVISVGKVSVWKAHWFGNASKIYINLLVLSLLCNDIIEHIYIPIYMITNVLRLQIYSTYGRLLFQLVGNIDVIDINIKYSYLIIQYNQKYNYNTSSESSRSWRVLQGIVSSVSEGTIKAYGFNCSAIGVGMEVVVELSRKSGSHPFVHGVVLNLENQGRVGIIILGDHRGISCGDYVYCTDKLISSEVGFGLLGTVVNPLGISLLLDMDEYKLVRHPVEIDAPSIVERKPLCSSLRKGLRIFSSISSSVRFYLTNASSVKTPTKNILYRYKDDIDVLHHNLDGIISIKNKKDVNLQFETYKSNYCDNILESIGLEYDFYGFSSIERSTYKDEYVNVFIDIYKYIYRYYGYIPQKYLHVDNIDLFTSYIHREIGKHTYISKLLCKFVDMYKKMSMIYQFNLNKLNYYSSTINNVLVCNHYSMNEQIIKLFTTSDCGNKILLIDRYYSLFIFSAPVVFLRYTINHGNIYTQLKNFYIECNKLMEKIYGTEFQAFSTQVYKKSSLLVSADVSDVLLKSSCLYTAVGVDYDHKEYSSKSLDIFGMSDKKLNIFVPVSDIFNNIIHNFLYIVLFLFKNSNNILVQLTNLFSSRDTNALIFINKYINCNSCNIDSAHINKNMKIIKNLIDLYSWDRYIFNHNSFHSRLYLFISNYINCLVDGTKLTITVQNITFYDDKWYVTLLYYVLTLDICRGYILSGDIHSLREYISTTIYNRICDGSLDYLCSSLLDGS